MLHYKNVEVIVALILLDSDSLPEGKEIAVLSALETVYEINKQLIQCNRRGVHLHGPM